MGLCRVVTKNSDLLHSPTTELRRVVDELSTKCHVTAPPILRPNPAVIEDFIDVKMQKAHHDSTPCVDGKPFFNVTTTGLRPTSLKLYRKAMALYCDMETGVAFEDDYDGWPETV